MNEDSNKIVTARAPGKLMIMGEHAVVYGYPCIVSAIDKYIEVKLTKSEVPEDTIQTPGVSDNRFITVTLETFRKKFGKNDFFTIGTKSDITGFGLGSSSAATVALVKALLSFYEISLDNKKIFDMCFEIVKSVQGEGSGFDIAAAIYGGTLYFVTGGKKIEELPVNSLPVIVGFSGIKADTVKQVSMVKEKMQKYGKSIMAIFENISRLTEEAKQRITEKDWVRVGKLFNYNQDCLESLGVSTEKLNGMVIAARIAGAYGAKLSGAGGGDCMIALVSDENREAVKEAVKSAGGEIINI